eukprot:TCALIF_03708-PA protein Name:"Similar to DUSP22 Dual specificity protein phosphatase 22 (Homo sapiens)" AED:0.22 eAED:0.23 QI:0/0/0/0.75/1/1/4/0/219
MLTFQIVPGLYVGSFRDSKDLRQLDIRKITHILSICDDARKIFKDKKYLIIGAADSPKQDLAQYFPLCNDFIHPARIRGGHVLIHCLAGISRSVTVAAAYLLSTVQTLNHQEALQAVRAARIVASPNIGFQKQLADFEHHGLDCVLNLGLPLLYPHLLLFFRKDNALRKNSDLGRPSFVPLPRLHFPPTLKLVHNLPPIQGQAVVGVACLGWAWWWLAV